MKAYEIPDFLDKKIRRESWEIGIYIYPHSGTWIWCDINGESPVASTTLINMLIRDDWEEYKEEEDEEDQWYEHEYYGHMYPHSDGTICRHKTVSISNKKWNEFSLKHDGSKMDLIPLAVDKTWEGRIK